MIKILLLFWTLFVLTLSISAQEKIENQYANIPTIDYCEIIKNPNSYNDKTIKVFAEYSAGFEQSVLGNQLCKDDYGQVWVEWEKYQSCGDAQTTKLLENREKGIEYNYLEGTFVGKFFAKQDASGFGHMNAHPYKLIISCVESATLLPKKNSGCERIDKTNAFHFLEYVKTESGLAPDYEKTSKKTEKIVWLRLVNNSSCSILVPTVKSKAQTLQNKNKYLVAYELTAKSVSKYSRLTYNKPQNESPASKKSDASVLPAGQAIYFGIPLRYFLKTHKVGVGLKDRWNVTVPFKYTDRQAAENYDPFYFSWRDLPKDLLKK